ncbi:MAG TPA: sigma-70 family RNA polymerase sigma factor [Candidatus Dormibacteraeota bacterium]|jgi:RNA polymerase sigma factor (sigma-70 family)|nr:sigma-70 family RNA polymerase sigma factor [Candidatus Dormibacteraeota bacterium]
MTPAPALSWEEESVAFALHQESETCWRELARTLRPLVMARLGGSRADCEDVLSETFLALVELRARGGYDPDRAQLPTLARSIAERRCIDRLRQAYRHPLSSLDDLDSERSLPSADASTGVEQRTIAAEATRARREAFRLVFRELQRSDRAHGSCRALAVFFRYRYRIEEDDYTFLAETRPGQDLPGWREVAARLGISEEAARQNGSRGLRALRALWRERFGELSGERDALRP